MYFYDISTGGALFNGVRLKNLLIETHFVLKELHLGTYKCYSITHLVDNLGEEVTGGSTMWAQRHSGSCWVQRYHEHLISCSYAR